MLVLAKSYTFSIYINDVVNNSESKIARMTDNGLS